MFSPEIFHKLISRNFTRGSPRSFSRYFSSKLIRNLFWDSFKNFLGISSDLFEIYSIVLPEILAGILLNISSEISTWIPPIIFSMIPSQIHLQRIFQILWKFLRNSSRAFYWMIFHGIFWNPSTYFFKNPTEVPSEILSMIFYWEITSGIATNIPKWFFLRNC